MSVAWFRKSDFANSVPPKCEGTLLGGTACGFTMALVRRIGEHTKASNDPAVIS